MGGKSAARARSWEPCTAVTRVYRQATPYQATSETRANIPQNSLKVMSKGGVRKAVSSGAGGELALSSQLREVSVLWKPRLVTCL